MFEEYLDDQQRLIVQSARDVAADFGADYFTEKRLADEKPHAFLDALAEAGFFGIPIPTEYGGEGLGLQELVFVLEALGAEGAWEAVGEFTVNTVFGGIVIAEYGTEEQKAEYLPKLAAGELTWSLGVTEPNTGSNMLRTSTFAEPVGDGEYLINGEKTFNSGLEKADGYTLLTRTKKFEDVDRRTDGLTVFLVDPENPAIEYEAMDLDIHWPAGDGTYIVHIDDLRVDESQIIGEVHQGFGPIFEVLNPERITLAAEHLGAGRWALDRAVDRAKEREVWGEPIGVHQGVQHPLAESFAELETASTMVRRAAKAYDDGAEDVGPLANVAHLQSGRAAFRAADNAVETFGGASAAPEYGIAAVWSFLRHQRIAPIPDNMKLNYIANNVLGLPRSYGV